MDAVAPLPAPLPRVIGLIAGEGDFPVLVGNGAHAAGIELVVFGIHGLANGERLQPVASATYSLKLTEISKLLELCHRHGIGHVVMAGRVPHAVLLRQVSFDPKILRVLGGLRNKKADSLLKAATDEIEREGIEVLDSTMFLRSCMPAPGLLTPRRPLTDELEREMLFGYPIAKEIARLDVGQTIAVKNQIVVAVEGVEGTDLLIKRAGELAGPGVVIVKVSKPRQDMRFDVPVVGIQTIRNLVAAGAAGLCVTAGQSLFFDRAEAIAMAEEHGICIYSYKETGHETPYEI